MATGFEAEGWLALEMIDWARTPGGGPPSHFFLLSAMLRRRSDGDMAVAPSVARS
jgi:hypothetical protein